MSPFVTAVGFLTRIPVPGGGHGGDLRRAAMWFPFVGVLVAALGVAVRAGGEWLLGAPAATMLALAATIALTGAFHEDGLADTADGVWGGWSPEQRLRIMRDSRLGTYGTLALILSVGLRFALLVSLPLAVFGPVLLIGHVTGQAAGLALAALLPPARDQGHGARAAGPLPLRGALVAAATTAVVLAWTAGRWAAVPLLGAALAIAVLRRLSRRRLGGLTGDVLGAANQAAHVLSMAAMVALWRQGLW